MSEIERKLKEKGLEGFLLSLIDSNPTSELLIKVFSVLEGGAHLPLPPFLFSLVIEYLKERGDYLTALELLKVQSARSPQDVMLRQAAIELLKLAYPSRDIDAYISHSHLDGDREIPEGILAVENLLRFDVGRYVFSETMGLAKIKGYDFLLDKVFLDLSGKGCSLPIEWVFKNFRPLPPEHYLVKKETDRESLKRMAENNPLSLFVLLLRSFRRLEVSEIKAHLSGVVSSWEDFWQRARSEVLSHPHIKVLLGKERVYEWSEQAERRDRRRKKESAETSVSSAVPLRLMGPEEVKSLLLSAFSSAGAFPQKRLLLERVRKEREDWQEIYTEVFFSIQDQRLLGTILSALPEEGEELLHNIFANYRLYPYHFAWLVRSHKDAFPKKALFARSLELLANPQYKNFWRHLKKGIKEEDFREAAIKEMSEKERERIASSLRTLSSLLPYEKDELKRTLERFAPAEERRDVIYSTPAGIKKAEEELRLLSEELKENAERLARARSYGDLSENYEYKVAKEERNRLLTRVEKLKRDLRKAVPISPAKEGVGKVEIGSRVFVRSLTNQELKEFTILGPWDIDIEKSIISYLSPVGSSLLGKRLGEVVEILGGSYEVVGIEDGLKDKYL